jgi:hypothetical protein
MDFLKGVIKAMNKPVIFNYSKVTDHYTVKKG